MVKQKLTDLIPMWGLYDMYRRKDSELDSLEKEANKEIDRIQKLKELGEINSIEQKQKCDALVKKFDRKCRYMIAYGATLAVYNIGVAYGFCKFIEYLSR